MGISHVYSIAVVLVVVGLLRISNQPLANSDQELVHRVLDEAPAGWQRIRKSYDGTSFSVATMRSNQARQAPSETVYVLSPNVRTEMFAKNPAGSDFRKVELFNSDYRAVAVDIGTGTFALNECENRLSTNDSTGNGYVFKNAYPGLVVAGIYFPEAIVDFAERDRTRSWGYKIDSATESTDDRGNKLVVLSLKYVVRGSNGEFVEVVSANEDQIVASKKCTLVLAPWRDWAAVEFVDMQDRQFDEKIFPMVKFCRLEYSEGAFHPTKKVEGYAPEGREKASEVVFSYGVPAKSDDEYSSTFFRLSSLGLAEPPQFGNDDNKFNLVTALVLVGIGIFAILIVLRRRVSSVRRLQ